jgi:hypothetical protein
VTDHPLARPGRLGRLLAPLAPLLTTLLAPPLLLVACSEAPAPAAAVEPALLSATPQLAAARLGVTPLAVDERGVPRLLGGAGAAPAPAPTATASAIAHLSRLSAAWGVRAAALPELAGVGEVPAPGGTIARVRQSIDGLPIEGGELRVLVGPGGELVAANGALASLDRPRPAADFPIDDAQAIARAVAHNFGRDFAPAALAVAERRADGTRTLRGGPGGAGPGPGPGPTAIDVQLARARQVWHDAGGELIPAWVVEAYAGDAGTTSSDAFRTVLTADGERVLSHESLVADAAFRYRVYAETTGELRPLDGPVADYSPYPAAAPNGSFPAYIAPALVTVDGMNHPASGLAADPWLAVGRTETLGNNVEAYSDVNAPSGLTYGDFRATITSTDTFDRTFDLTASPLLSQTQQMASITSTFYGLNWLHDFWHDAGFTEAAGNAQNDNYGRGGQDRDALLAETQDNAPSSLNNANMSTPADGLPPRMQIFVWTGKEDRTLTFQPANRSPVTGTAQFGLFDFDASGPLVLGTDGTDPVNDACTPLTNDVAQKIVLVDRGNCTYKTKALNVQTAGGLGILIANHTAGGGAPTMGNDTTITEPITIALLAIPYEEGVQLKLELAAGPVTAAAHRRVPLLDGGLDSTLLAHEFGHYLHHRLHDCTSTFCRAISEGWGDFLALMLMVQGGDNYDGAYPFSIYTTQSAGFSDDAAYFGIRRAPYSASPAINALAYRHMANDVALPTAHPFNADGNTNAEVHNAGEIWAATMFEVYVALLKAGPSFTAARAKMAKYVVAGLLLAPKDATPTETRDAILAAALPADRPAMMAAFARRGMGSCATTPARDSIDFVGIVDGFTVSGRSTPGATALAEATTCDDDNVLDAGETATIALPLANRGHLPLTDLTVTVTSATPGLTVTSAPVAIESFAPGASQSISATVALDRDVAGMLEGDLELELRAAGDCTEKLAVPFKVRLNVDDLPKTSATDAFDAASVWVPSNTSIWSQVGKPTAPLDRVWHAADVSGSTDTRLESPLLEVSGTEPFKVTFSHRYKLDISGATGDAGVVEYSIDGGGSWLDVSKVPGIAPSYTGMLTGAPTNPLGGRLAYVNQNVGYPAFSTVTLDFGTQLKGKQVKLRFRAGTDQARSGPGWDIDEVAITGITNKPFPTQIEDRTTCVEGRPKDELPPDDLPGCCDARPIRGGNLALALGVVALVLRRRRR